MERNAQNEHPMHLMIRYRADRHNERSVDAACNRAAAASVSGVGLISIHRWMMQMPHESTQRLKVRLAPMICPVIASSERAGSQRLGDSSGSGMILAGLSPLAGSQPSPAPSPCQFEGCVTPLPDLSRLRLRLRSLPPLLPPWPPSPLPSSSHLWGRTPNYFPALPSAS
jgi:hypothetical protein